VPGEVDLPEAGLKVTCRLVPVAEVNVREGDLWTAHLDAGCVGEQLIVRRAAPGDRLTPLGMRGRKKLQDLLVDKKIPRAEREGMVVVATSAGEIVWLIGQRISERAKVTGDTRQVAVLEVRPAG
jgi:tRNA(Ile)-lysidine synthase